MDRLLHFLAGKEQNDAADRPRRPFVLAREIFSRAFVPPQLTFEGADVIETSLDLDDQQRARRRVEGEQIDPAAIPTIDERHLACRRPSVRTQSTVYVCGAPGMDQVAYRR